jgi:hypothetical protein
VALTATNAAGPITSPVTSLLVYNTATAGTAPNNVTPGFYMWDGAAWQRFDVGNNIGDWKITGNNNTTSPAAPGTYGTSTVGATENMIGTRNAADVVFATNNIEQMRLISGGRVAIGSATGTATAMLSVNTYTNALRDGIAIAMSGASSNANGVSITAGNVNANGFYFTNSTSALSSAVFGLRAELTSTNIVSGYAAYRNSSGRSYGLFGITGTNAAYTSSNANTWAAFMQGRVVISGEGSPTSLLGTDLEVRNTTLGAGNPAVISIRQNTSNTASGNILGNLNFGDDYATTPQAQIQITRSAISSNSTDLPTDIVLSNTPDNSATLTERMRISQNGNVGIGTSNIPNESRLVLGAIDGVNEGGQIQLNAPGGSFTTAFFVENYQNMYRVLTGSNTGSLTPVMSISSTGVVNLPNLSPSLGVYTDASRNLTTTVPTSGQLGYWTRSGTQMWNTNTGDNVGIGTTPNDRFDVLAAGGRNVLLGGGGSTGSELKLTNSGTQHFSIYNNGNSRLTFAQTSSSFLTNTAGTVLGYFDASGNFVTTGSITSSNGTAPGGTGTTNYLARWTGTNTLGIGVTFDNGTNVGIGTTSPASKLEIQGNPTTTGEPQLRLYNTTNATGQASGIRLNTASGWNVKFQTAQNIDWFQMTDGSGVVQHSWNSTRYYPGATSNNAANTGYISGDGTNIGIGTTAPAYKFSITGTGIVFGVDNTANFAARNASGTYEQYLWPRWSDNVMYMNYGSAGLNLRDNASNTAMFIDASRNVGFPTQTGYKVTIGGDLYVNGGWARVAGSNGFYFETWTGGWQMTDATWLRSFNSKSILATGGLAGFGNTAFGTQFGGNPRLYANYDNLTGGGIAVSDDGGFYDYNDGWITYRGSQGVKIKHNTTSSDLLQLDMVNVAGTLSDRYLGTGTDFYGYVGISGRAWYRMYSYGYITASKRELKRNIIPVKGAYADRLMSDLDRIQPTLYKYIGEEDRYFEGKETKFRPNYHLGLILDEAPDYLQDDAFGGIELYSVATMGVLAGKLAVEETKNIKSALGWTSDTKNIQDFGSVELQNGEYFIPYSETFKKELNNSMPVISITSSNIDSKVAVIAKSNEGFTLTIQNPSNAKVSVDYILLAKINVERSLDKVPADVEAGLTVSESTKDMIRNYWAKETVRAKTEERKAATESIRIIEERKKIIENQIFDKPENGPVSGKTGYK